MSKNRKKFAKNIDKKMPICYTLTIARRCAQALDTSGIHGVRPAQKEAGNRYGYCAMSKSTMARLAYNLSRKVYYFTESVMQVTNLHRLALYLFYTDFSAKYKEYYYEKQ